IGLTGAIPRVRAWRPLGIPLEAGAVDFRGRATGPDLAHATMVLEGEGRWMELAPFRARALTAEVAIGLASPLRLEAEVQTEALDVVLQGTEVPLQGVVEVLQRGEELIVGVDLADRRDPDRRVEAEVDVDVAATEARLSSLELHGGGGTHWTQAQPTVVDWSGPSVRADLLGDAGRLTMDVSFAESWPRGRVETQDLDLAALRTVTTPFLAEPLPAMTGGLTARIDTAQVRWPWAIDVRELSIEDVVQGLSGSLSGQLSPEGVTLAGTLDDAQGELVDLAGATPLVAPGGPSGLALACGRDEAWATLTTSRRTLAALAAVLPFEPPEPAAEIEGTLGLVGDPCDPELILEARVRPDLGDLAVQTSLEVRDGPAHIARAVLRTTLDGIERGQVEAMVEHASPRELVGQGLDGIGAFDVTAALDDLPSQMVLPAAQGLLRGRIHAGGHGRRVDTAFGTVDFLPANTSTPLPRSRLALATREGQLTSRLFVAGADRETVRAEVDLDVVQRLGLDAPLTARIDGLGLTVAQLAGLAEVDVRRASGEVRVDGTVAGTLGHPDPDLRVELLGGAAALPALGVRYEDAHVVSSLKGDTLIVQQGVLRSRPRSRTLRRDGRGMTLVGTVMRDEQGVVRPDLTLTLDRSWLLAARDTTLQASGEVRLHRPGDAFAVDGRVRVDEGRVLLERAAFSGGGPSELHPDIVFVDTVPPALFDRDRLVADSPMADLDLDLEVDFGEGVDLEATVPLLEQADAVGQLFDVAVDAELDGTVRVTQRDGALDLRGRLSPTGRVQLLTARFDIDEGSVSFAGGDLTEPTLDLRLLRDSGAYGTVRARLQGTPSTLSLSDLSSEESSAEEDVVSLLLFGRPLSEFDPDTSGAGADAVDSALVAVAGHQVAQALGGSVFDTVDYSNDDGLSLGWSLGGGGFLTVSVDALADADDDTVKARLTWLLTRRVEAGVDVGDTGTSAGWLVWRRRF
ncbi:MAG: translocation/assembly module TamB domain-containing protein, partial [Myxococcota bacterium]